MAYRFSSYEDLAAVYRRGTDYLVRYRNGTCDQVLIMTPHGGRIEKGASELAEQVAGQNYSFYAFEGHLKRANLFELHIPSEQFNEPISLDLTSKAALVVAIHGRRDYEDSETIWMGGLHTDLRRMIGRKLYEVGFKIDDDPPKFQGRAKLNICNRGRDGRGVQLEMPLTLRETLLANEELRLLFTEAVGTSIGALVDSLQGKAASK